jgi:ABC-type Fe3+ transport system permease subunit
LLPELTMSVLLFGPQTQTLGTTLFELATYTDPAQAAALGVVLSALCVGLHTWAGRRAMVGNG